MAVTCQIKFTKCFCYFQSDLTNVFHWEELIVPQTFPKIEKQNGESIIEKIVVDGSE